MFRRLCSTKIRKFLVLENILKVDNTDYIHICTALKLAHQIPHLDDLVLYHVSLIEMHIDYSCMLYISSVL